VLRGSGGGGDADADTGEGGEGERSDVGAPPPGTVIESGAVVKRVDETTGNVQVTLPGGIPGVVTAAQMSDHPLTGAALAAALKPGDAIGPLVAGPARYWGPAKSQPAIQPDK